MAESYTPEELLGEVNAAIQKVLVGGQSYKIGSRSLTRADLKLLQSMRADLMGQINQNADSHLIADTYVAIFDSR